MSERDKAQEGLTLLGSQGTQYPKDYDPSVLETFDNKHPGRDYFVKFNCPEFTSLCPITGQPDFATIYISYVPRTKMVESKSLKLYLFSFRNHGDFHEDCVNIIMNDLIALMEPAYIEVCPTVTMTVWPRPLSAFCSRKVDRAREALYDKNTPFAGQCNRRQCPWTTFSS